MNNINFNRSLYYSFNKTIATLFLCLTSISPTLLLASERAELDCIVKPEMYIELSSPVIDGIIESLLVEKGDTIKKGQPLAQLEASVELIKVKLAKMDAASNNEILNRKTQLEFAKRNKIRLKDLYTKKSISLLEKDKSDTEAALAKIEVDKATEKRKIAWLNLELANARLALKTIKSPIEGIVIDRYAMVGETVKDRAIMKLAQVDPLRVELVAPTEYFDLIKKDMEVEISPERPANKTFKATVTNVDQLIDPASGSFTVSMSLPNTEEQLVVGVNCVARFSFNAPSADN